MKNLFCWLAIALLFVGCKSKKPELRLGNYQLNFIFNNHEGEYNLPIDFKLFTKNDQLYGEFKSSNEIIQTTNIQQNKDSIYFKMPVFQSEFKLGFTKQGLAGVFTRTDRETSREFKVVAFHNKPRFSSKPSTINLSGRYKVNFKYPDGSGYPAIGELQQVKDKITGSFITETGDYRYLEGVVNGDSLKLTGFDGAHVFLFLAKANSDSITGLFKASISHKEFFTATLNDTFQLRDGDSLTFLKPGYSSVNFKLPNINGDTISSEDERYQEKPLIIQITGSWCPNCMDETRFLAEMYNKYNAEGLEVVALSFERFKTFEENAAAVFKIKQDLNVPYTSLIAGLKNKETINRVLPMLNHVMSYPTAIFIDKNGKILKIQTGFSGPGTSVYNDYVINTEKLIQSML